MATTPLSRKPYPTDVSDEEWAFVAPYLTLLDEDSLQRRYPLREVFNALLWIVRAVTGDQVELAWVDQGYTGEAAAEHGIQLVVVQLPAAKRGFVLLPRRWGAERSVAWEARFRRLARDYERLPVVLAGLHFIAFACLLLHQVIPLIFSS